MFLPPHAAWRVVLFTGLTVFGADLTMKVTESGYLDAQGFSVILYHSVYDRTFVDQKNTAMEMILHGQRIATNGDVRMDADSGAVGRGGPAEGTRGRQRRVGS